MLMLWEKWTANLAQTRRKRGTFRPSIEGNLYEVLLTKMKWRIGL